MRLLVLLAALGLASCAQIPGTKPSTPNLLQFTDADLTAAIALAQAAAPTNMQAGMEATCFTFLKTQLANLAPAPAPTGTVGAATAFVTATLATSSLANAISPVAQAQFAINCGPLMIYTANQGATLASQVGLLGTLLAPKP